MVTIKSLEQMVQQNDEQQFLRLMQQTAAADDHEEDPLVMVCRQGSLATLAWMFLKYFVYAADLAQGSAQQTRLVVHMFRAIDCARIRSTKEDAVDAAVGLSMLQYLSQTHGAFRLGHKTLADYIGALENASSPNRFRFAGTYSPGKSQPHDVDQGFNQTKQKAMVRSPSVSWKAWAAGGALAGLAVVMAVWAGHEFDLKEAGKALDKLFFGDWGMEKGHTEYALKTTSLLMLSAGMGAGVGAGLARCRATL